MEENAERVEYLEYRISHSLVHYKSRHFLTTTTNMLAEPIYVAYRTYLPDERTVNEVKQKLEENNIDIEQLVEWPVDHCQPEESSTENDERKGT